MPREPRDEVLERRDAMFAGARINTTENRAVLHVALRAQPEDGFAVEGQAVGAEVEAVLAAMARFAGGIRDGSIRGATGWSWSRTEAAGPGATPLRCSGTGAPGGR